MTQPAPRRAPSFRVTHVRRMLSCSFSPHSVLIRAEADDGAGIALSVPYSQLKYMLRQVADQDQQLLREALEAEFIERIAKAIANGGPS